MLQMQRKEEKMKQETQHSILMAAENGQKYDESCKQMFRNREIIAPILKYVVEEFRDCTQEEIIRCIDADSITEEVPVDELPSKMQDLGTEMTAVFEKTIHYDVHFKARNPKLSDEKMLIMLHVDFEVQNDYRPANPRYPIIKRAIYYVAREISSQLGTLTEKTNYADIEKAYSIWVCNESIPENLQNTITRYSFTKEDVIGKTDEPEEDYDLMEVILIRRGKEAAQEDIFQYLESIFTSDIKKMRKYVDIPAESKIEREVARMTGLGQAIYDKGLLQGREQGIQRGEELMSSLMQKLFADGRTKDAELALTDEELRKQFYREYGLVE